MTEPDLDPVVQQALAQRATRFEPTRGEFEGILDRARRRERIRRTGNAMLALGIFAAAAMLLLPRLIPRPDDGRPAGQPTVAAWIPVGGELTPPVFGEGKVWTYSERRGAVGIDPTTNEVSVEAQAVAPPLAVGEGSLWGVGSEEVPTIVRIDPVTGEVEEEVVIPHVTIPGLREGWIRSAVASVVHRGELLLTVGGATVAHIDASTNEVLRGEVLGGDYGAIVDLTVAEDALWILREGAIERRAGPGNSVWTLSSPVPSRITLTRDTVWGMTTSGEILRWSPEGGQLQTLRPDVHGSVTDLAIGEGRLWVVATRDSGELVVTALDPSSGETLGEVSLGGPADRGTREATTSPSILAAAGAVWVTDPAEGMLIRIDPTGRSFAPLPGPTPSRGEIDDGEQRYRATTVVLEDRRHGPMLCLGGMLDSLPPQCGDVPITNWDWEGVEGEERVGKTIWGEYEVIGTYDGTSFTVEEVHPPSDPEPAYDRHGPLGTPCPEPEGGWVAPDPLRASEEHRLAATRAAEREPDFSGVWVSHEGRFHPDLPDDMIGIVLNVAFTGDVGRHEAELGELWGGPLCVTQHRRTYRELRRIQRELSDETLDYRSLADWIDVTQNAVVWEVVTTDDEREAALAERFGEGAVRVWPALHPVP